MNALKREWRGMMVVAPGVMGISVYSPPLDEHGNSVRGVEFCEKLVDLFNFHHYDVVNRPSTGKRIRGKNEYAYQRMEMAGE